MCVRICFTSRTPRRVFDADTGTITLPAALAPLRAVTVLRAVLTELAVVQPPFGAVCWCGEQVELLPRVPEQMRTEQVMRYGV